MLIPFAVTITVLLALCGLAIDGGLLALKKTQLQTAADAAAIGASYQAGNSQAAITAAGRADAARNGFTDGTNGVTVTLVHPPTIGAYANNPQAVQAMVSQVIHPFFFSTLTTLTAQATATAPPYACAYFLSQSTLADSISLVNDTLAAQMPGCSIYLGRSYYLQAGSSSTGYQFLVANSTNGSLLSMGNVSPAPYFNIAKTADPLGYVPAPAVGACTYTTEQIYDVTSFPPNNPPLHVSPGVYCGGLSIQNSGYDQVVLDPGLFVIAGPLVIGGPAGTRISGSGVTIYMTQKPGYLFGQASINSTLSSLSAPTTGSLQGILYFSDRSLPAGLATLTISASNPAATLDGILYLENQQIHVAGARLAGNQYFGIVADNILGNNSDVYFSSDYSPLAGGDPFQPTGGGLVE